MMPTNEILDNYTDSVRGYSSWINYLYDFHIDHSKFTNINEFYDDVLYKHCRRGGRHWAQVTGIVNSTSLQRFQHCLKTIPAQYKKHKFKVRRVR